MKERRVKNRESDGQSLAKQHVVRLQESKKANIGFGPWIFVTIILAIFLSPIGERFVGYLKFRATRTSLQIKCDDRLNETACVQLSFLYYLNGYNKEAIEYQNKVCSKSDHLKLCKEKF